MDTKAQNNGNDVYKEFEIPLTLLQYLGSEECNLQNICRICLSTSNEVLYPLSSHYEYTVLTEMFEALTSIHVSRIIGTSNKYMHCHVKLFSLHNLTLLYFSTPNRFSHSGVIE